MATEATMEELATRIGGKWLIKGAPDDEIPAEGMMPIAARRLRSRSPRPCPVASTRRRPIATPLTLVNTTQS